MSDGLLGHFRVSGAYGEDISSSNLFKGFSVVLCEAAECCVRARMMMKKLEYDALNSLRAVLELSRESGLTLLCVVEIPDCRYGVYNRV